MGSRLELQTLLEGLLGTRHVYFQAPPTTKMSYPCIMYERSAATSAFADNAVYRYQKRYTVTVIDQNPDSLIPDKIAKIPRCVYDRHYPADGLHHDVFNLYF